MRKSSKGNPYHDEKGRFCSRDKAVGAYVNGKSVSLEEYDRMQDAENEYYEKRTEQRRMAPYYAKAEKADSLDELNAIVEEAAWDESISNESYSDFHEHCLNKARSWIPQPKESEPKTSERLTQFEEQLIEEEKRRTRPEFRDDVTLKDAVTDSAMLRDIESVRANMGNAEKLKLLKREFTKKAEEYAADWYDEDLGTYRSGYEWEANFYKKLADLCD